ncbi:hypothetical protein BC941DRAFT_82502 [Chlamydoabsidia padenii]|nr:hypothetical protein BC941DRAFT_82502 [Chlamydoabsidia padenii]
MEIWNTERSLQVHQNVRSLKPTDPPFLYHPVRERRRIWERVGAPTPSYVDLVMSLSRSIWTSGSSLYVSMMMENKSVHRMRDVKLELIKRQNTYSQTGLHKSFDLMPVTSTCELVACTSLLALGWWKPLDPNEDDHVLIPLEIPMHEFTIKHQKLIDVSFALRVSISSLTSTDAIIEIPITLAHPISADPPPGSLPSSQPQDNNPPLSPPLLSSSSSSSLWSSYSPSSPLPPLPPKTDHPVKKKRTMVTACEALMLHTAGKCKSAFFSSAFFHGMRKKPLLQKLSSSFTYSEPRVSPSGTLLALAPSQKFEISVQELDLICPASPHHKRFYSLLSMKKKKKKKSKSVVY